MKILVNSTTLVVGGGIQVGVSFIQNVTSRFQREDVEWLFLVSNEVFINLDQSLQDDDRIVSLSKRPSRPFKGWAVRRKILKFEKEFNPDLVYSIGFPSYINFRSKELGRYTNPWEINPEPLPWHLHPFIIDRFLLKLGIMYRRLWAKNASYIETQTAAAADGISKKIGFSKDRVFVIPNSANSIFESTKSYMKTQDGSHRHKVFSIAAGYPHKNLAIIPKVAHELRTEYGKDVEFLLTLDSDSEILVEICNVAKNLDVLDLISNVGKLNLKECLGYYEDADVVFLPTLLEVFSATYLESMAVGVPIVTTDLDFARDNCGDAALFYSPYSHKDAASKINDLLSNISLREDLINKGIAKLGEYPTTEEKYDKLYEIFSDIVSED